VKTVTKFQVLKNARSFVTSWDTIIFWRGNVIQVDIYSYDVSSLNRCVCVCVCLSKWHEPLYLFWCFAERVHLSIILVINQLNAQNLFYNNFIICLHMFRALCAHHQVKFVLYSIWYHHTCRWPSRAQIDRRSLLSTCAPDDHLQVWWYQMPYNTILTSWWWAHSARNM